MFDLSARVFGAILPKLKQPPYLVENGLVFRVAEEDSRIKVTLTGSDVEIEGFLIANSLMLRPEKVYEFYGRLRDISRCAVLDVISLTPEALQVQPKLSGSFGIFDTGISPEKIAKEMAKREGLTQLEAATMWFFEIGEEEIDKFADCIFEDLTESLSELSEMKKLTDEFRVFDLRAKSIKDLWEKANKEKTTQEKGKILENLISTWITSDDNFCVKTVNSRTESEEIDIIVENKAKTDFLKQLQSPLILVECKNWSDKVGSKEIRDFAQKIQNRPRFLCKVGLIITTSQFTRDSEKEIIGYRGKDFLIVTADRPHLQEAITKGTTFSEFFREQIYTAGLR